MPIVQPTAFILVGKPGGGKGTVLQLLKKQIEERQQTVFTSDTGEMFRMMIKSSPSGLINANDRMKERIAEINNAGLLQVSPLAGALWTTLFVEQYQWEQPYIIMDGSPRRGVELLMLEEFLNEFIQAKIQFISIETDDEMVIERMLERHTIAPRPETSSREAIMVRLNHYHELVGPTIEQIKGRYENNRLITIYNNGSLEELKMQVNQIAL